MNAYKQTLQVIVIATIVSLIVVQPASAATLWDFTLSYETDVSGHTTYSVTGTYLSHINCGGDGWTPDYLNTTTTTTDSSRRDTFSANLALGKLRVVHQENGTISQRFFTCASATIEPNPALPSNYVERSSFPSNCRETTNDPPSSWRYAPSDYMTVATRAARGQVTCIWVLGGSGGSNSPFSGTIDAGEWTDSWDGDQVCMHVIGGVVWTTSVPATGYGYCPAHHNPATPTSGTLHFYAEACALYMRSCQGLGGLPGVGSWQTYWYV
ncbi:MAG: hypothetical protein WDA16_02150 [Candidatus Thermoplasmatota archaeon]